MMGWLSDGPWHVPPVCVYASQCAPHQRCAATWRGPSCRPVLHPCTSQQRPVLCKPKAPSGPLLQSKITCYGLANPSAATNAASKARARQMRKQTRSKHWMRGARVAGACASAPAPTLQRAQGRARAPTAGEGRVLTMPNANGSLQTYAVHARTFTQMHTQMHLRMGAPSPDQRCLASRLSRDDPRTLREAARKLLQRTRTWR